MLILHIRLAVHMKEIFLNPLNYVPFLEEMKHAYARRNGSILDKVSEMSTDALMEFMIGANACRRLQGSSLIKEIYDKVQKVKEQSKLLEAKRIADRCFPKFTNFEEIVIESYALREPALVSFMTGVLNFVFPKELISTQQRADLIKFIAEHLLKWRAGTRLLGEDESYPMIEYAVLVKEIRLNLMKLWKICDNDKYLAQDLLDGISINLTHFLTIYVLHSLRSQTKVGLHNDVASFYYIPTYNEIKRHIPVKTEVSKTRSFSVCSADDSEVLTGSPSIKSEVNVKATSHETKPFITTSTSTGACGARDDSSVNGASSSTTTGETIAPAIKRIKREPAFEDGHDWSKMKFPRDRPPDDIPVYDYTKVKREKFDLKSSQEETDSHLSNNSSSNNVSAVDEWEDVLKSVTADQSIPEGYKMAFRCLVMSNRDLREHNRILRMQLEKG
uniref:Uncharacterized protein n=1 Tax=Haemonchus contortus TaxID=6289 RepID=A0A7I5E690_HAECO